MKVRICFTVDVDDDMRRAITHHYCGDRPARLATREEIREHYEAAAYSMDEDFSYEYNSWCEGQQLRAAEGETEERP